MIHWVYFVLLYHSSPKCSALILQLIDLQEVPNLISTKQGFSLFVFLIEK